MIIDDSELDIFIHKKVVEGANIAERVLTFSLATDALNLLKLIEDDHSFYSLFAPQLIILDINMPLMNGFKFLTELDKLKVFKKNPIGIFMVSTSSNLSEINEANIRCSAFIEKPLTSNKLLNHFNNYQNMFNQREGF